MKKLVGCLRLRGLIRVPNGGLRIGGNPPFLEEGGAADFTVIRNPINGEPYIPGSSLKGRLRAMLEKVEGKGREGDPCNCGRKDCLVCLIFGAHKRPQSESSPTRIIVRDAPLTAESSRKLRELEAGGKSLIEEKGENLVDRDKGTAEHPRFQERVWDAEFQMEILMHVYDGDEPVKMLEFVRKGLGLEQEIGALGAGVSRGSGQVRFENISVDPMTLENVTV
jgi:CRISPR-associated protein Csm3